MEDLKELLFLIAIICLVVGLLFGMRTCTNLRSKDDWNNGVCATCEERFELKAASQGLKYYACPQCGLEVKRY